MNLHSLHGTGHYLKSRMSISLSKNILSSYGTPRFITVPTKARHHPILSQPNPVRPIDPYLPKVHLMSFFHCLGRAKESVQVRGVLKHFYGEGLSAPRPTPKLEDHNLSAVHDCLFNLFAATLRIWRPSLHPQPEDAPCRGDKGPPIYFGFHKN